MWPRMAFSFVTPALPRHARPFVVTPAKAGVHVLPGPGYVDARLRGHDGRIVYAILGQMLSLGTA
jgi:hypothetical protein